MGPTRERTPHEHFHPFDFPRCRHRCHRLPAAIEAGIKANDDRAFEESLGAMSPFEVKNLLVKMAKKGDEGTTRTLLNAGRGNPNWITTLPREAILPAGRLCHGRGAPHHGTSRTSTWRACPPPRAPPRVSSPSLTSTGARSPRSSSSAPGTTWMPRAWAGDELVHEWTGRHRRGRVPHARAASCATPKRSSTVTW